ncbi:MAG: hypothetical protein HYV60_15305 [Planctomycetia bacterium]|nr:hypothetical protein [Planctomycetia bacterium]
MSDQVARRGEAPREFSRSNVSYASPMMANIQLGNPCARVAKKFGLNVAGEIANGLAVNELAGREPCKGWGLVEVKS